MDRLRSPKLWATIVLLAAVGAGGYYGIAVWTESRAEEETAQTQLVPVTRGDLVNDVSVTGSLSYTTREFVTFGQPGVVGDVSISEGDEVSAGDVLAVMDADTIANLEKAIAQARIDVRDAEEALEAARDPVSAGLLAQARVDILNARIELEVAIEDRGTLLTPTIQDLGTVLADIAAGRVALEGAKAHLSALLTDEPDQSELDTKNRTIDREIELAEAKLTAAEAALATLLEDPVDLVVSQAAVRLATESLVEAEEALEGYDSIDQLEIRLREADLVAAKARLDVATTDLERAIVRAPVSGYVVDIYIATGDQVNANTLVLGIADTAHEIDELELESKKRAIETAEADLLDAETALANLLNPPESDIELTNREIELAQARLAEAEEALASLIVDPLEIEFRQADLVAARASLDAAVVDLERSTLRAPFGGIVDGVYVEEGDQVGANTAIFRIADDFTEEFLRFGVAGYVADVLVAAGRTISKGDPLAVLDALTIANLERAIVQARIDVRDAEEALAELNDPVSPGLLAQARIDILAAQTDLDTAREKRVALLNPTFQDVVNAQAGVTVARVALQDAKDDLDALLTQVTDTTFGVAGTVGEVLVVEGDRVSAGDPLAMLDAQTVANLEKAIAQARVDVRNAEDAVEQARIPHSAAQIALAEYEVADARLSLQEAEEALSELDILSPDLLTRARIDILRALVELEVARENRATEITPMFQAAVRARTAVLQTVEAAVLDGEAALAGLMQPYELDIELADREIELAQAKLDEAEAVLEEYNSVDQLEIELRQADLVAARASLETAIANLDRATLRAPFDGLIVAVNIETGQQVNVNTQAVEIADPSIVEVSGSVDEIDVLFLQEGAQAFVSMEALGSQTLPGTVSSIAGTGTSEQGVVTYPVTIRLDTSESGQLPEGLSATAQVIIREETDSVLIPLQALYGSVQAPTVKVVSGNTIVERPVTLGISDDFWVVVEEGLDEGETIVMEVVGSSTSQFGGIGATFRAVGGGFGPRRGGGGTGGGGGGGRGGP